MVLGNGFSDFLNRNWENFSENVDILEMALFMIFLAKLWKCEKRKIDQNKLIFVDFVNDFDDFVAKINKILIKIMFFHKIWFLRYFMYQNFVSKLSNLCDKFDVI